MVRVVVREGEDFKNALKRFRKACEREGVMHDMKKYMFYESKGTQRRRAKLRSIKNHEKEIREAETSNYKY